SVYVQLSCRRCSSDSNIAAERIQIQSASGSAGKRTNSPSVVDVIVTNKKKVEAIVFTNGYSISRVRRNHMNRFYRTCRSDSDLAAGAYINAAGWRSRTDPEGQPAASGDIAHEEVGFVAGDIPGLRGEHTLSVLLQP